MVGARRLISIVAGVLALSALSAAPASAQPVSCGQTITQDTKLDADLSCFQTGNRVALFIGADGITLDLGGHAINADRSIVDDGHDNVTIRNGTLNNDDGPLIQHASDVRFRHLRFQGITTGLALQDAHRVEVRFSSFPGAALEMSGGSSQNTIAHNEFTYSEGVIFLMQSDHNRIVDNRFSIGPDGAWISLRESDHNYVARNRMEIFDFGIALTRSNGNVIADNVIRPIDFFLDLESIGVDVSGDRNVVLRNNTKDTAQGVHVRAGNGNWLVANRVLSTVAPTPPVPPSTPRVLIEPDGLRVESAATDTVVAFNRAGHADDDGIDVEAPSTSLLRNTTNANADLGIEAVPGVNDLGGNRATGNGNPLQCLNVVCR